MLLQVQAPRARHFVRQLKELFQQAVQLYRDFHDPTKAVPDYADRAQALDLELTWQLRARRLVDAHN